MAPFFQVPLRRKATRQCNSVLLNFYKARRWVVVAEVIRRMAVGDAPDPLPKQQVIALDYEALFTNLSDDTLTRQERRKRMLSPLVDKLAQVEPDSEEASAMLDELFRWPDLEE